MGVLLMLVSLLPCAPVNFAALFKHRILIVLFVAPGHEQWADDEEAEQNGTDYRHSRRTTMGFFCLLSLSGCPSVAIVFVRDHLRMSIRDE